MRRTVIPGTTMVFEGVVVGAGTDDTGTAWVDVDVTLRVDDEVATECRARMALLGGHGQSPWRRRGDDWTPGALPAADA